LKILESFLYYFRGNEELKHEEVYLLNIFCSFYKKYTSCPKKVSFSLKRRTRKWKMVIFFQAVAKKGKNNKLDRSRVAAAVRAVRVAAVI